MEITHNKTKLVRLPKETGMVPLKRFVSKALEDEARRQDKRQVSEIEGYAQPCQTC